MNDVIIRPETRTVVVRPSTTRPVIEPIMGEPGLNGRPGVYVGPTPPSDTTLLWVDTS